MTAGAPAGDLVRLLVERILAGIDYEASCEVLYRLLQRRVKGFFAARGFSPDEAAELTQQTFIRVFTHIRDLHDPSRFLTWLFEIAVNILRNELRWRGAAKRDAFEASIEQLMEQRGEGSAELYPALNAPEPSPLEGALSRERRESLRAALDQLPPQMRRCVVLRIDQDLKYREIAVVMNISIETVKAHLHQAQQRLKMALSEQPDDDETEGVV